MISKFQNRKILVVVLFFKYEELTEVENLVLYRPPFIVKIHGHTNLLNIGRIRALKFLAVRLLTQ